MEWNGRNREGENNIGKWHLVWNAAKIAKMLVDMCLSNLIQKVFSIWVFFSLLFLIFIRYCVAFVWCATHDGIRCAVFMNIVDYLFPMTLPIETSKRRFY